MPYKIYKRGRGCYEVVNTDTGRIHSKCTTLERAKKQVHLLYGVEHGFIPTGGSNMYGGLAAPFQRTQFYWNS